MTDGPAAPRVRFAPSPTGYIHLGNVRSALFNYAFARKHGGQFLLRIEDTDQERHVEGADGDICEVLSWLGCNWNEGPRVDGPKGPYYQSERLDLYRDIAAKMLADGLLYPDFSEAAGKDRPEDAEIVWELPDAKLDPAEARRRIEAGEPHCLRMRVDQERYPDRLVSFTDIVRGEVRKQVEDFVVIKRDGFPTYHFGVVIDDHHMCVSHVIRGIGHLDNTVKHVVLYEALGWNKPRWAHHSHTTGLSKRKGSPSVGDLMRRGYLPEAVTNMCMLLGWYPKDGGELFDFRDRFAEFRLEDFIKSDSAFDPGKFRHVCQHHMAKIAPERLLNLARPFLETSGFIAEGEGRVPDSPERLRLLKLMAWVRERIACAAEILDELWAFRPEIVRDEESRALLAEDDARLAVRVTREKLAAHEGALDASAWKSVSKAATKDAALKGEKIKGKRYFHPMRAALTGRLAGPDLGLVLEMIGREPALARLDSALA